MHGFIKQFAGGAFDPEATRILTGAFDDAWEALQASKAPFAEPDYALTARTIIAKHIIATVRAAKSLDRHQLAEGALLHLSRQKLTRTPPRNGV